MRQVVLDQKRQLLAEQTDGETELKQAGINDLIKMSAQSGYVNTTVELARIAKLVRPSAQSPEELFYTIMVSELFFI